VDGMNTHDKDSGLVRFLTPYHLRFSSAFSQANPRASGAVQPKGVYDRPSKAVRFYRTYCLDDFMIGHLRSSFVGGGTHLSRQTEFRACESNIITSPESTHGAQSQRAVNPLTIAAKQLYVSSSQSAV